MSDVHGTPTRHPLAPLVELLVFAPVGAVMQARAQYDALVALGREETLNRVRVARMVGEFAVRFGRRELERRLGTSAVPAHAPEPAADDAPAEAPEAAPRLRAVPTSSAHLAVPGYDSLAASQVVARLASLSPEELAHIRDYEAATRRRRTILNRIEQLAG